MSFVVARSVADAIDALANGARPVAGGSDLVVGARHGAAPLPEDLVAIDRIRELSAIDVTSAGCRIGAGVTHALLMADSTVLASYSALADGAALVGSPATRNVGTIGGNIMNGSPAMDTGSPLVVLDASVELCSRAGTRTIAANELWTGPGQTSASADELCTAVILPARPVRSGSGYVRLEYRRAMEIAVVGAAASVVLDDDGMVTEASIALTAVAPTILAVESLDLTGRAIDGDTLALVASAASEQATPISDLRASDAYRRHTIGVMAKRAFAAAARRASGETIAVPVNRAIGLGAPA